MFLGISKLSNLCNLCNLPICFVKNDVKFTVYLIGGSRENQGNIYAFSPRFGKHLPVCGYFWTTENVSLLHLLKIIHFVPVPYNL